MNNRHEYNPWEFRPEESNRADERFDRGNQDKPHHWQNQDRFSSSMYGSEAGYKTGPTYNPTSNHNWPDRPREARDNSYRPNADWNHELGNEHYGAYQQRHSRYDNENQPYGNSNPPYGTLHSAAGNHPADKNAGVNLQQNSFSSQFSSFAGNSNQFAPTYNHKPNRLSNRDWDTQNRNQFNWSTRDSYSYNDQNERGFFTRAGDEVRSWFGDEAAERRRKMDEQQNKSNRYTSDRDWM